MKHVDWKYTNLMWRSALYAGGVVWRSEGAWPTTPKRPPFVEDRDTGDEHAPALVWINAEAH